ncbi:nuclear transport factor 2 family protein [uncultured Nitratireductor sp.]|uniref:nuclear transport factor 2 family protein n=1 Tax=uncultured Nitratireductor sp. TaxID=520953 RepID=UPI0025E039A1|nr:nuclear transport factor 2 family protein [uncultured Nitratireductor sp.]
MPEEKTRRLVQSYLDALNANDHDAALALVSEDVAHDPFDGEREIGREKLRWRLGLEARHFDERFADIAVMSASGGVRAAAEFTVRGTYRKSADGLPEANGQSYVLPGGMFFEVDGNEITRISEQRNPVQWRAALSADR